ncbi:MAG: type IV pilus biogenesis protein PilM [Thermovirgaceae bacterium]
MALFGKGNKMAGLALSAGSLRYIELEGRAGDLSVARSGEVPIEGSAIDQEMISDTRSLEDHLMTLKSFIGGNWAQGVVLGMPSREVLMRIVEMPAMEKEDAREALKWDFEKYFPFPYGEAVFDLSVVDTPGEPDLTTSRFLVAAARLRAVENLLEMAKRVGLRIDAIEPLNVPLYRCVKGPGESGPLTGTMVVYVGKTSSQIIVGFGDNGILYRTLLVGGEGQQAKEEPYAAVTREVSSTFTYLGSQFRELRVDEVILCGDYAGDRDLTESVAGVSAAPVLVSDPWGAWGIKGAPDDRTGWEPTVGLAVRDLL